MKCVFIHANKKYLWGSSLMPRTVLSAGFREVSKTDLDPGLREL